VSVIVNVPPRKTNLLCRSDTTSWRKVGAHFHFVENGDGKNEDHIKVLTKGKEIRRRMSREKKRKHPHI